jgi:mRNA interferase HigB
MGACYSSLGARSKRFTESRAGHKDQAALKAALDAWFDEVRKARWTSSADVKRDYRTASIVSAERVVFNVNGNDYRLGVAVDYEKGIVWIKWLGPMPSMTGST